MSNSSTSGSNTSTGSVAFRDKGAPSDSCISAKIAEEIIDRFYGVVDIADNSGIQVSVSAPTDVTKIWFQSDATGQVISVKFFNSLSGAWEVIVGLRKDENLETLCEDDNAIERLPDGCIRVRKSLILENSENSGNLIDLDENGKLIVSEAIIRDVAAQLDSTNQCNVLLRNDTTKALSVNRGAGAYLQIGPTGGIIQGQPIAVDDPDPSTRTFDLTTIAGLPADLDFDVCPPSHIQVTGVVSLKAGAGASSGSWASPTVFIKAGHDLTRIALAVDADAEEGTDMNTAIVRLDPVDPKTFLYQITDIGSNNFADGRNHVGLYLQALVWGSTS